MFSDYACIRSPVGSNKGKAAKVAEQPKEDDTSKPLIYDEFDALRLKQNEGKSVLEYDTLDAALDEFFAKVRHFLGSLDTKIIEIWAG